MTIRLGVYVGVVAALLSACGVSGSPGPTGTSTTAVSASAVPRTGQVTLSITTQLGDQCPQVPVTPDPRCDPKPRPNTAYEVRTASGDLVTKGRTDAGGHASVPVDRGSYVVRGEPVAGYQFTPERRISVGDGAAVVAVPLTYTNGIQ